MKRTSTLRIRLASPFKTVFVLLMSTVVLSLAGCGSTTQVYDSSKTIVHAGNIYNVTEVKVFSSTVVGVISESETVDLKDAEKQQINDLLDAHETLLVRQIINLDDQEMLFQEKEIDSWSDFRSMEKDFSSANSKLTKFLADKKKTQIDLD